MTPENTIDIIDVEEWATAHSGRPLPKARKYKVRLWSSSDFDKRAELPVAEPTGQQILEVFELLPADERVLMVLQRSGIDIVELNENIDLSGRGVERFFAFHTDRMFNVSVDGKREPWGDPRISGAMLRLIYRIPDHKNLVISLIDEPDRVIVDADIIDLEAEGLERLFIRPKGWKLNVQGVKITSIKSEIVVSDALVQAGFDPNQGWVAILKVAGEPRRNVALSDTIDLSNPGIEKLRLRPTDIQNGEVQPAGQRNFSLLTKDEEFLNRRGLVWETIIDDKRRWLIFRSFILPKGYNQTLTDIAIDVPDTYPAAQIDMFFCHPHLELASGVKLPQTHIRILAEGKQYQQWSRHLQGGTRWNPTTDSVITHMALVDESLIREVAE